MKCPFCHIMPTGERDGIVRFDCGMVMAAVVVQRLRSDEIEVYRLRQSAACIRGERDLCIRMLVRIDARVAELEEREKRARDDEAWANGDGLVEFQPVTAGWVASTLDGVHGISATAPTIHKALRALREKMEARP